MSTVQENLARVEDLILAACRAAARPRSEVELMAVSKLHPVERLLEAAAAGQTIFGENRVQEFAGKDAALKAHHYQVDKSQPEHSSSPKLRVHLIGHLQSNKASRAAELFTQIDTLDSLKLAERLNSAASTAGSILPVLLEIKLSHEPTKEGLSPESEELAALLERLPDLDHLAPRGMMTVAPLDQSMKVARACFRTLRNLRETLNQRHPRLNLTELSMGMSGDFAIAIEEGSTQVRLGTAIFGPRLRAE